MIHLSCLCIITLRMFVRRFYGTPARVFNTFKRSTNSCGTRLLLVCQSPVFSRCSSDARPPPPSPPRIPPTPTGSRLVAQGCDRREKPWGNRVQKNEPQLGSARAAAPHTQDATPLGFMRCVPLQPRVDRTAINPGLQGVTPLGSESGEWQVAPGQQRNEWPRTVTASHLHPSGPSAKPPIPATLPSAGHSRYHSARSSLKQRTIVVIELSIRYRTRQTLSTCCVETT